MYLYRYKAKLDGKLPFWDRYPLIIMVDYPKSGGGFFGLNLHYLPPRKRILLLDSLIKVSNLRKISENSKMKLSYGIVKAAAKYWQPCFKRYLYSHVVTKPIKINPEEWYMTASLPLASFKGANRPAVYKWSSKYY